MPVCGVFYRFFIFPLQRNILILYHRVHFCQCICIVDQLNFMITTMMLMSTMAMVTVKYSNLHINYMKNRIFIMSRAWEKEKIRVPDRNRNPWPPKHCPLSYENSCWARPFTILSSFVTRIPHTARIIGVNSVLYSIKQRKMVNFKLVSEIWKMEYSSCEEHGKKKTNLPTFFIYQIIQSNLDYPDLDYPDFLIIQTCYSGPIFPWIFIITVKKSRLTSFPPTLTYDWRFSGICCYVFLY